MNRRNRRKIAALLSIPPTKVSTIEEARQLNVTHRKKAQFRQLMREGDTEGLIAYFSTYYAIAPDLLQIPENLHQCIMEEFKDLNF